MVHALAGLIWVGAVTAAPPERPSAPVKPRKALRALAERFASLHTMSAKFIQSRRTLLLDKPIRSSGMLYYRRDKEKAVFVTDTPRESFIFLDATSYLVYRPAEKQAEYFDLTDSRAARWILLAFHPKPEEIEKIFTIGGDKDEDGITNVILEPKDEKLKQTVARLTLKISFETEPARLHRLTYEDTEGDQVAFDLTRVALDPKLEATRFKPDIPKDVRVIRHKAKK